MAATGRSAQRHYDWPQSRYNAGDGGVHLNITTTPAGRKLRFRLARLNYAGAQVLVRQGGPPLHIVAGGNCHLAAARG